MARRQTIYEHETTVHVPETAMSPPVHLELPPEEPQPASGCDVCQALVAERAEAIRQGDHSRATDCAVEIREHPHGTRA